MCIMTASRPALRTGVSRGCYSGGRDRYRRLLKRGILTHPQGLLLGLVQINHGFASEFARTSPRRTGWKYAGFSRKEKLGYFGFGQD